MPNNLPALASEGGLMGHSLSYPIDLSNKYIYLLKMKEKFFNT